MKHLIIGYGYCGYYLAKTLLENNNQVTAIARNPQQKHRLPGLELLSQDISQPLALDLSQTILYYLIPPPSQGKKDTLLEKFLSINPVKPAKVIYYGSSGVYGDHQGNWVDEKAACHITYPRQLRRLNAEQQWQTYCKQHHISLVILRIAGIYGPERLPMDAAQNNRAIIDPQLAPFSNHIYVSDLSNIAMQLATENKAAGIFNVSDGQPSTMGSLQQQLAKELKLPAVNYQSFEQAWNAASPMKREFLHASKRLKIDALKSTLGRHLHVTTMADAIHQSLKENK